MQIFFGCFLTTKSGVWIKKQHYILTEKKKISVIQKNDGILKPKKAFHDHSEL